jgi:hypothetical protein
MDNQPIPNITSFVIRFVHLEPNSSEGAAELQTPACRGSITHVQSNQEFSFTQWADAVAFMQRFVPIHVLVHEDRQVENQEKRL